MRLRCMAGVLLLNAPSLGVDMRELALHLSSLCVVLASSSCWALGVSSRQHLAAASTAASCCRPVGQHDLG